MLRRKIQIRRYPILCFLLEIFLLAHPPKGCASIGFLIADQILMLKCILNIFLHLHGHYIFPALIGRTHPVAADSHMGDLIGNFLLDMKHQLPVKGIHLMRSHLLHSGKILAAGKLSSLQLLWLLKDLPCLSRQDLLAIMQQRQLAAELVRLIPAVGNHDHVTLIVLQEILHIPL